MGAHLSKRSNDPHPGLQNGNGTTSAATASNDKVHFRAELVSYEAECRVDAEIETFDTALRQRMSRAISTLAVGVEVRSLSLDSLKEITTCLLDMNQEVVKIILDCKKDIWKSPELFDLVEDYFENSLQTLDFCTVLEKCLKRARDSQLIVHVALQRFEEEKEQEQQEGEAKKYLRTLEELRKFKAAGDPFTDEFFREFQSVYANQLTMLEKLQLKKMKLDKKLKSVKSWRKVSSVIFVSAFVALLICSVVAAAIAAPPVASALAAVASLPIGSMGKWIDSLWKGYEDALRGQRELLSTMQVGSFITIKDLESLKALVDQFEILIGSMVQNVEFAVRGDEALMFAVEEIKRKLELFMKSIEDLGKQADRCSRDIRRARTVVLQRIIKNPK